MALAPYLVIGTFLWISVIISRTERTVSLTSVVILIVLILFTGLRYEIGYDWIGYERYFTWLKPEISLEAYRLSQSVLPAEPLYYAFNVLVKLLGGSFETLLFILAAFNLLVIDHMAKRIDSSSRPFVWFFYFCIALVTVQFNILRQAVASSFVIIALLCIAQKRGVSGAISFAIALGLHTSTAIFIPVLLLVHKKLQGRYLAAVLISSIIMIVLGNLFFSGILNAAGSMLPAIFAEKTASYADAVASGAIWGISPFAIIMTIVYIGMLVTFLRMPPDPFVNIAILLTVLIIFAHVAFGSVPVFWNRVMCVSLPWQLAVLWKYYVSKLTSDARSLALFATGGAALAVFSVQMLRPESEAFVPYHSIIQVWLFNDPGDGRARSMYAIQQGEIANSRRSR